MQPGERAVVYPVVYPGCQHASESAAALRAGHVCTLEQKEEMCRVEFGHDEPGGKGGDSVQGL